jgi:hypothetical protein
LSQDFIRSKAWRRNSLLYRCPFFRSTLRLLSRKHAFIREKVLGMNDKDAALAAGYSFPVAENT